MQRFSRVLVGRVLGLMAAMVMAGVVQASAGFSPVNPGAMKTTKASQDWSQDGQLEKAGRVSLLLLAQKDEAGPEKQKSPATSKAEPERMKRTAPPAPSMEKFDKSIGGEQLERAGTKKIGGEVIRNKEE